MFHSQTRLPTVINGTVYSEDNYNNVFQSRTRSSQGLLPVTPSTRSSGRLSALPVSISLCVVDLLSPSINNFPTIRLSFVVLHTVSIRSLKYEKFPGYRFINGDFRTRILAKLFEISSSRGDIRPVVV